MRTSIPLVALLTVGFATPLLGGEGLAAATNARTRIASMPQYQQATAQWNEIVAHTASAEEIHAALWPIIEQWWTNGSPLLDTNRANWPAFRAATARTVLTNLTLLELGIRRTTFVTNIDLVPPENMWRLMDQYGSAEKIRDPEFQAYGAASGAYGRLSRLHQGLLTERGADQDHAINALVQLYYQPPAAEAEVRQLQADFASHEFVRQFGERLTRAAQEWSERSDPFRGPPPAIVPVATNNVPRPAP